MGFFSDMNEEDFDSKKNVSPIIITPEEEIDDNPDETEITGGEVSRVSLGEDAEVFIDKDDTGNDMYDDGYDEDDDFGEPLIESPAKAPVPKEIKPPSGNHKTPVKDKQPASPVRTADKDQGKTIIAKDTVITGGIISENDIFIEGTVEGTVKARSVILSNGGQVKEGIDASENLELHGNIEGNISGKSIKLLQTKIRGDIKSDGNISVDKESVINGDISTGDIEIYGRVKGQINASGKITIRRNSIVKGNIRCKDILLETGARFQGAVEQISAEDIDDSLFE